MDTANELAPLPASAHDHLLRGLLEERARLGRSVWRYQGAFYATLVVGWFVPFVAYYWFVARGKGTGPWQPWEYGPLLGALVFVAVWVAAYWRAQIANRMADLQDTDFEIDLQQFDVLSRERRAEKLVRINNLQLRRYYDLILSQNLWVLGIGIGCILIGAGVIGVVFYLVLVKAREDDVAKWVIGLLGAISTLLVNYVAAIFLKMHAEASANTGAFHLRLVETNQLLMGNLLASRIENDEKRWDTLATLALRVVGRPAEKGSSPNATP